MVLQKTREKLDPMKHAHLAGVMFNTASELFSSELVALDSTATQDIEAFTPLTRHPIHFLQIDNQLYHTHQDSKELQCMPKNWMDLKENRLYTDLMETPVKVGFHKVLTTVTANCDVFNYSNTGNAIQYHIGMFCVIYISNKAIKKGELITWTNRNRQSTITQFTQLQQDAFVEDFKQVVYEPMKRFKLLQTLAKNWSPEQYNDMQRLFQTYNNGTMDENSIDTSQLQHKLDELEKHL